MSVGDTIKAPFTEAFSVSRCDTSFAQARIAVTCVLFEFQTYIGSLQICPIALMFSITLVCIVKAGFVKLSLVNVVSPFSVHVGCLVTLCVEFTVSVSIGFFLCFQCFQIILCLALIEFSRSVPHYSCGKFEIIICDDTDAVNMVLDSDSRP